MNVTGSILTATAPSHQASTAPREADDKARSGRGLTLIRDLPDARERYPLRRQPGKCVWARKIRRFANYPDPEGVEGNSLALWRRKPPHEPLAGYVRKVPQLLTITTSPSAAMRRSAATTVLRATPYSVASSATGGSRSRDCHSPSLIRARSAASTRWLGSSGVRSDGIQP
jgi:hypothetical protein